MKNIGLLIAGFLIAGSILTSFAQGGYGKGQGKGQGGYRGGRGQGQQGLPPGMAKHFDLNHDGVISKSEIRLCGKVLVALDKNKDLQITKDEMSPDRSSGRNGKGGGRGQGTGGNGQGRQGQGGPPAHAGQGVFLNIFDTDRNGTISKREISRAQISLKKYDRNRDGKITGDDLGSSSGKGQGQGGRGYGGGRGQGRGQGQQHK